MNTTTITYNDVPAVLAQVLETLAQLVNAFKNVSKHKTAPKLHPMDVNDAAKFLKVTEQTIYAYVKTGDLVHFKKGKKIYFFENDLLDWIESGRVKTKFQIKAEVNNTIAKYAK